MGIGGRLSQVRGDEYALHPLDQGAMLVVVRRGIEQPVLDEITEPRMLAGDLWLPNTQLDLQAPDPAIVGTYDFDRTWWGDPAADWTIRMVSAKQDERTAFWETYGPKDDSPHALLRARIYEAQHLGAIRRERHRLGNHDGVRASYDSMAGILASVG